MQTQDTAFTRMIKKQAPGTVPGAFFVFDVPEVQSWKHNFRQTGRGHKTIMPARPYLGISKTDERYIADAIMADLEGNFDALQCTCQNDSRIYQ
ncbi:protein of unknown function [Maridesulfovibrio hydrothermalis AM13 = DSM 14728]|uniref:Uncharacterized protein n=2 Tax=Maridesulfovibrio TaxID=2794998 RepID=L0R696_9BACT|nr:protein of unknown function [Maridesulfovibrio hydrothermalis AM13 = DSM 14728]